MATPRTTSGENPPTNLVPRVLAALALAVCILALIVVVSESSSGGEDDEPATERVRKRDREQPPKDHAVAEGETATSIARRFNVPLGRIERLNPDVDLQTLNPGELLVLR